MDLIKEEADVVIIGGSISGSATALMLKRKEPTLRICIVEKDLRFQRRVGESTVEISSIFLGEILGLSKYLNENHIIKQGLRFWFYQSTQTPWHECAEIGPEYHSRFPGYQIDRSVLDEYVLNLAATEGVQLKRGVKVSEVVLNKGGIQKIILSGDPCHEISTRWVVDAGGAQCMLARKLKLFHQNKNHPISSIWCRWKGVGSLDSEYMRSQCPDFADRCKGTRYTATNHFMGKGWWSWCIPLKNGDVSIGVVYDERHINLDEVKGLKEKLCYLLNQHPVARELLKNAEPIKEDLHSRRKLPYYSDKLFGDGFTIVGDAAGFIDPFYSSGLDWISYTTCSTVELIMEQRMGHDVTEKTQLFNHRFEKSYHRWFEALYKNKYDYMGDFELMNLAFKLDLGTYYLGIVSQPFKIGLAAFSIPSFSGRYSSGAAKLIKTYNNRLSQIARRRMRKGTWGRKNEKHYHRFQSYELNVKLNQRVLFALFSWLKLEIFEGWKTWFKREKNSFN